MNMRHWSMKWLLMLMAATMVAAAQDLSFEGLLKDGVKSYNNGDYKTAAEKFEDAGKLRPDDARVKYNEALSRYMNKEYEAAENGFQTAKEKGYAEDDNFKAVCDLGIGNCHYERSMQIAKDVEGKQPQEAVKQLQEAKASCEKSIDSYRDALRYSQKLKNVQDNLKTARHQRKEIVKTLRKLEEELKQQPQQQQGDQKQDGEKQDGEQQQQQQQGDQKQDGEKQDGEKQDGEQQQQNAEQQQQKDAGEQLEQLAKRQSEEAEKNEQGQQNQQQAADEQKKLSDETEQTRQAMEQQRKEAEKQDGQSSEKSEAEKKLEEAQDAQKKAEESLEKGDMKSASEAQKEAAEKLEEARKAMSEGEKKDEEEQKQDQQQQEQQQQQPQQEGNEEQMSETDNDIQNILDQERNNQRKRLKLLRVKPVERDW
jgi:hypothetical protein